MTILGIIGAYIVLAYHEILYMHHYALPKDLLSIGSGGIATILTVLFSFLHSIMSHPIHKQTLVTLTRSLDDSADSIAEVVITSNNSGKLWFRQRELLTYLVSNIKIDGCKVRRHLFNTDIIEEYENVNIKDDDSLQKNATTIIKYCHEGRVGLFGHKECNCVDSWKNLHDDQRIFVYMRMKDNSEEVYAYRRARTRGHMEFYPVTLNARAPIKEMVMNLNNCVSAKTCITLAKV